MLAGNSRFPPRFILHAHSCRCRCHCRCCSCLRFCADPNSHHASRPKHRSRTLSKGHEGVQCFVCARCWGADGVWGWGVGVLMSCCALHCIALTVLLPTAVPCPTPSPRPRLGAWCFFLHPRCRWCWCWWTWRCRGPVHPHLTPPPGVSGWGGGCCRGWVPTPHPCQRGAQCRGARAAVQPHSGGAPSAQCGPVRRRLSTPPLTNTLGLCRMCGVC